MADIVRAGYQLGPPPYGYTALRIRITSPDGQSKLRAVLVPDRATAPVVRQVYQWRTDPDRPSFTEIAHRLNHDPHRYPPPTPNGRWSATTVKRLVTNPKYTGRQVWARTTHRAAAPAKKWITSAPCVHEPLVDDHAWRHAQPAPGGDRHAA